MFAKISRFFIYASLAAPLVVIRSSFFPFITGKAITFRILVELALLAFLCYAIIDRPNITATLKKPIVIATAVFGIIYLIAGFTGVNPQQSLWSNFERGDGSFQLIHYVIFFILVILLFPDKKSMSRLVMTNIGVSVLACLYAIGQLVNNGDANAGFFLATSSRVSGTFGNPSYLAAYILINLAFIAYFFLQRKNAWSRSLFGALFVFETYVLLNTGTRGAFLALIVGLLLLCAINMFTAKSARVRILLATCLAIVIGLPAVFFATPRAPVWERIPIVHRLINYESAVQDVKPRLWTWNTAIAGIKDRPIIGYGAENFAYPFDTYYNPNHYGIESFFDRTHNIFLEYLIDGGILLLLAWLAIFYCYYRRLMREPKDLWWSILFIVPIVYACQGFFLFDTLPIYIILFLFLAFSSVQSQEMAAPSRSETAPLGFTRVGAIILLTAGAVASLYYTDYIPARKNYLITRALTYQNIFMAQIEQKKNSTITPAQIITSFEDALKFNSPVGQEEAVSQFQKFVLYIIDTLLKNPEAIKNPEMANQIRKLVDRTDMWFDRADSPFAGIKNGYLNGGLDMRVGLALNQPDLLARGKRTYARLLAAAPNRLELIRVLIEVARQEKDMTSFNALIAKAKILRPDVEWK